MEKLVEVSDQEVQIDFSLNCKCRGTVRLQSLIATCPVAFKVQTSSPHKFLVNPPSGLIPPLSYATFQLILKPQSTLPSHFPRSPSDRFLIKTKLAPNSPINFDSSTYDVRLSVAFVGHTLLRYAVGKGDLNAVKKILKRQRSLLAELPAEEAESLLQICMSDEVASFLVEGLAARRGDCRDREGRTALMVAAGNGCEGSVRVLAGAGADVDARSEDGRTGLYRAAVNGDRRMVEVLMELGADPTIGLRDRGRSPIDVARERGFGVSMNYSVVVNGDRRMVEVLMELGADPTIGLRDRGRSPIDVARERGFKEVIEILEQGETVLTAARRGDSTHLERLLNRGASTTWRDQYGMTPLHVAAIKGHKDTVTLLLEFKSELDGRDYEGHTPLHLAVEGGWFETVEVLLNRGANLNAKSNKGATPLYIAKVMGFDEIFKFLSQRGASDSSTSSSSLSSIL